MIYKLEHVMLAYKGTFPLYTCMHVLLESLTKQNQKGVVLYLKLKLSHTVKLYLLRIYGCRLIRVRG
jgi:hypothetical protein